MKKKKEYSTEKKVAARIFVFLNPSFNCIEEIKERERERDGEFLILRLPHFFIWGKKHYVNNSKKTNKWTKEINRKSNNNWWFCKYW